MGDRRAGIANLERKSRPHIAPSSALPEFFIKLATEERDLVIDPFAGSNTTGAVCERINRRWLSFELNEEYVRGGKFRFEFVG